MVTRACTALSRRSSKAAWAGSLRMRKRSPAWPSPYSIFISWRVTRSMQMLRCSSSCSNPGMWSLPSPRRGQRLVAATYPDALAVYRREAFRPGQFDIDRLRRFCQALPGGFELRQVRLEEVTQFATDLAPALIYNFRSHEEFITRGVGLGILHQGMFVSGASSAAVGGGKFEIEIRTHRQFRRRGLARAVAAGLILYCLEHGIEACWDAANEPSAALARQLGFRSTGKYEAYRLITQSLGSGARGP